MKNKELWERFDEVGDEILEFHRVECKRSTNMDVHAIVLLDEIFESNDIRMIRQSEFDDVEFCIPVSELESLSDAQILELTRCGVTFSEQLQSLVLYIG